MTAILTGRFNQDGTVRNGFMEIKTSSDNARYCKIYLSRTHVMEKWSFSIKHLALMETQHAKIDRHGRDLLKKMIVGSP